MYIFFRILWNWWSRFSFVTPAIGGHRIPCNFLSQEYMVKQNLDYSVLEIIRTGMYVCLCLLTVCYNIVLLYQNLPLLRWFNHYHNAKYLTLFFPSDTSNIKSVVAKKKQELFSTVCIINFLIRSTKYAYSSAVLNVPGSSSIQQFVSFIEFCHKYRWILQARITVTYLKRRTLSIWVVNLIMYFKSWSQKRPTSSVDWWIIIITKLVYVWVFSLSLIEKEE